MKDTNDDAADDFSLQRVPQGARFHWLSVAVQRFGMLSGLASFLVGATLGFGMTFWNAFLAITFGAIILEVVTIFIGIAGQKEGLSTSVLARWTGFGRSGSAFIGLAISISAIGWFGIQNAISARGLQDLLGVLPLWGWALIFGMFITLIVMAGFGSMAWTAYITVPTFVILAGYSIVSQIVDTGLHNLITAEPAGPTLTLVQGTGIVAGAFVVGAVITPDMSRFNRSAADVVKQTLVGITLGEYVVGLAGVLLALALKTNDIVAILTSSSGFIGAIVVVAATLKINDWNLYASSLGVVNFIDQVFGRHVDRRLITLVLGTVGTVLGAIGILDNFVSFLTLLSVVFPPICGIMVAEYFVVKRWRADLTASGSRGELPATAPTWVPGSLVIWAASAAIGHYVHWGMPSINSLVVSLVLYVVAAQFGLTRGFGLSKTTGTQSVEVQKTSTQHL
jgi:cytosine permease